MLKQIRINRNLIVDGLFYDFLCSTNDRISLIIRAIETEESINFIGISEKPDSISYLPMNKYNLSVDPFMNPSRVHIKIGRIIYKLFSKKVIDKFSVHDSEVEIFVNRFKSFFDRSNIKMEVIEGESLRKFYSEEIYLQPSGQITGTLWNSCMRYQEKQALLDLYTLNPKQVKMLVMTTIENGDLKLRGRALLWKTEGSVFKKSYDVMDRIYCVYDSDVYTFKRWAKENGYITKYEQNSKTQDLFEIDGQKSCINLTVRLENFHLKYYPYLDTFCFFDHVNGILYNYENIMCDYKLSHANGVLGGMLANNIIEDEVDHFENNEAFDEDELIEID